MFLDPETPVEIACRRRRRRIRCASATRKRYRDRLDRGAEARSASSDAFDRDERARSRAIADRRRRVRVLGSWAARWVRWSASASCAASSTAIAAPHAGRVLLGERRARACRKGCFSLLQMAKTSSALAAACAERSCHSSPCMTDPTTGGVSASLAMLGDVNIAEPRALIGFAGPRVIQQTVRRDPARGLPAQRVPARTRRDRHDPRPPQTCVNALPPCSGSCCAGPRLPAEPSACDLRPWRPGSPGNEGLASRRNRSWTRTRQRSLEKARTGVFPRPS